MTSAIEIFGRDRNLIGMVHVHALPGTPRGGMAIEAITQRAVDEAKILADAGFDALIIENMHDVPYLRRNVGPEIVASMTAVGVAVRAAVDIPIGVQILAGANREALAVAQAIGGSFIRAEGFIFAAVADEGLMDEADAGPLLRYRRMVGAEDIAIFADIKKKHSSHAITSDVDLAATAQAVVFCGADGLIVTGTATGEETNIEDVKRVREAASGEAVLVGSGVTPDNAPALLEHADALIVGSSLKRDGIWSNPIDPHRAGQLVHAARAIRR